MGLSVHHVDDSRNQILMELLLEVRGKVCEEEPSGLQSIVFNSWVAVLEPRNAHSCDVFNVGQK
jgi:hypothetical protein